MHYKFVLKATCHSKLVIIKKRDLSNKRLARHHQCIELLGDGMENPHKLLQNTTGADGEKGPYIVMF